MTNSNFSFKEFWQDNKWKIFAVVFAMLIISLAVTQCNISPEPQFSILCVSGTKNPNGEPLKQQLSENIDFSKTDEGEMDLYYEYIQVPDSKADRVTMGTNETIYARLANGDCSLLLFDKETVQFYYEEDGMFVDLREYADKYNIPDENLITTKDGKTVCAISVEDNKFLTSCSFDCTDLYAAIRVPVDGNIEKYTNAKASLEYILSNK